MPALPALLLSTYVFIPLLTMAPHPFSWADAPTALRMGEYGHLLVLSATVVLKQSRRLAPGKLVALTAGVYVHSILKR